MDDVVDFSAEREASQLAEVQAEGEDDGVGTVLVACVVDVAILIVVAPHMVADDVVVVRIVVAVFHFVVQVGRRHRVCRLDPACQIVSIDDPARLVVDEAAQCHRHRFRLSSNLDLVRYKLEIEPVVGEEGPSKLDGKDVVRFVAGT